MATAPGSVRHVLSRGLVLARLRPLLLAATVALAACLAPTLPVPPPSEPEVSAPDSTGLVTVQGRKGAVSGNAVVTVWNETYAESAACRADLYCNPGVVRVANPDGSYAVHIVAKSKDLLHVWQTLGNEQSAPTEAHVP